MTQEKTGSNGVITIPNGDHKSKILYVLDVFDKGAEAYKIGQILFEKIDKKIHNEYAYFGRANVTVLRALINDNIDDDFSLAIDNATEAACHILNDCLDLIFLYAKRENSRLSKICTYSGVNDVYKEHEEVMAIINTFAPIISKSRKDRGTARVQKYIELTESNDYKVLVRFCLSISTIEENLKKKRKEEIYESRKWLLSLFSRVVGGIIVGFIIWKYFKT